MFYCSFYEIFNEKTIITFNNVIVSFIEIQNDLEYKIIYEEECGCIIQILKLNNSNYILFNLSGIIYGDKFENNKLETEFVIFKTDNKCLKIIELNNSNLALLNSDLSIDIYNKYTNKENNIDYINTTHLCTEFIDFFYIKSTNDIVGKGIETYDYYLLFINNKEYKYGKKINIRGNNYFAYFENKIDNSCLSQFLLLKDDILCVCNVSSPLLLIDLKSYEILSYINRDYGGGYLYFSSILNNNNDDDKFNCYGVSYTRYCSSGLVFDYKKFKIYENFEYDKEFFKTFQIGKFSLEEIGKNKKLDEFPINIKFLRNNIFLVFMKNKHLKLVKI